MTEKNTPSKMDTKALDKLYNDAVEQIKKGYGSQQIRKFLHNGGDIEKTDEDKRTLLSLAAYYGSHSSLKALLSLGAKPNTQDKDGFTPLSHCAVRGDYESGVELLKHGANPFIKTNDKKLAIDLSLEKHHLAMIKVLENHIRSKRRGMKLNKIFYSSEKSL